MKLTDVARAVREGLEDGWESPDDLGLGTTYRDPRMSEAYDRGVNLGQAARIFARAVRTLGAWGP